MVDVQRWASVIALITLPVLGGAAYLIWLDVRAARRRDAGGRGVCPNCGYDLRATPNRCPECGARVHVQR